MSLIEKLPLFPLGLVLCPGERIPLHIFEPRYKLLVNQCLETNGRFGILFFSDGKMARTGCTARVERVLQLYDDGRMDVVVAGEERMRVLQLYSEQEYLTADVERIIEPEEETDRGKKERAITQHMRFLELAGRTVRPSVYEGVRRVSYLLAANAGLEPKQKQQLLELLTENERIAYLTEHLETVLTRADRMEKARRLISSNGNPAKLPPGV